MYCSKCHKKNPNNFVNCAYCGAPLTPPKKEKPQKFVKKTPFKTNINFKYKTFVLVSLVIASMFVVAAVFTANFSGAKSEKVVKTFVKAIGSHNKNAYFSLYDDNIKLYKKENRYFGEEETFNQIVQPIDLSNDFYTEKCGERYKLTYTVKSTRTLSDVELDAFKELLTGSFNYINEPSKVDVLSIEVIAKGRKGEYKSIYNDFWCMKIKGRWYKVDKTIYAQFLNSKEIS